MKTEISILIRMQRIDDKISELENLKEKLPKQLEQLITNVKKTTDLIEAINKKLAANQNQQRTKENEVATNNNLKKKYMQQLDGIKTNKEYKALNSQIVTLTDKNTQIDTEIIALLDEEAKIKKQKDEAEILNKKAKENLTANEVILKKEIDKANSDIENYKAERMELAKQVLPVNLKKYILLIKNKNRKAVVYCHNNACSGCGFHIRPQILIELSNPVKIIYCENCSRILVKEFD